MDLYEYMLMHVHLPHIELGGVKLGRFGKAVGHVQDSNPLSPDAFYYF
jgi:hypothetical protein